MGYFYDKKVLSIVRTEYLPFSVQEKTITPQNFTHIITPDTGYVGMSKVTLNGVLVDTHQSYTSQTDNTTAYQKTTPTGALKYASLDKVGGMSYKSENLWNEQWLNGGYDDNTGTYYSGNTVCSKDKISINPSTTYKFICPTGGRIYFYDIDKTFISVSEINSNSTFTTPSTAYYINFRTFISYGETYNNDITITNNTTLTTYQPYFTGVRDSAITSVVSKDSNNTTLDTKTIAGEIQALTGYGWGINDTCYNYVDFENKKFIQKVGRVVLNGNENGWTYNATYQVATLNNLTLISYINADNYLINSNKYEKRSTNGWTQTFSNIAIMYVENGIRIDIKDISFDNLDDFKNYLSSNNLTVYYELATPIETDISSYIDDNFIEVEPSGTITFNNTYNQAVPSEITYLKEVQ